MNNKDMPAYPALTGREPWVVAANSGYQLFATKWGKELWWPIHDIELDCGLIRIDVCGLLEILDLGDVAKIKWADEVVEQDNFYDAPEAALAELERRNG